jgi:hypothetical protein
MIYDRERGVACLIFSTHKSTKPEAMLIEAGGYLKYEGHGPHGKDVWSDSQDHEKNVKLQPRRIEASQ